MLWIELSIPFRWNVLNQITSDKQNLCIFQWSQKHSKPRNGYRNKTLNFDQFLKNPSLKPNIVVIVFILNVTMSIEVEKYFPISVMCNKSVPMRNQFQCGISSNAGMKSTAPRFMFLMLWVISSIVNSQYMYIDEFTCKFCPMRKCRLHFANSIDTIGRMIKEGN